MKMILEQFGAMEIPEMKRMNPDSFLKFCQLNSNLNLELDKHGNILVMAPVGFEGSNKELKAATALDNWNDETELGYVTSSQGGYTLPNGSVRMPDAAWVASKRIKALSQKERTGFPPLCPDFLIEVRSASDSLMPLQQKMEEYMENGCQLAFLIDPIDKQAFIYRAGKEPEWIKGLAQSISGEDILPGFSLDLKMFA